MNNEDLEAINSLISDLTEVYEDEGMSVDSKKWTIMCIENTLKKLKNKS